MRHRVLIVYILLGYLAAQAGFFAAGQLPGLGGAPDPADAPGCPDADEFAPATVTDLPVAVHVVDTSPMDSNFVAEWTWSGADRSGPWSNVTVVRSRAEMNTTMLTRRHSDGDYRYSGVLRFLNGTDFGNASVVVYAFPHSSTPDFQVESANRFGDRVHLWLARARSGRTGDETVETVFVCVPFDAAGATVRTFDGRGATT